MLQIPPLSILFCGFWLGVCSYLVTCGALKKFCFVAELHDLSQDVNTAQSIIVSSCVILSL